MALKMNVKPKPVGTQYAEHLHSKPMTSVVGMEKKAAGADWKSTQSVTQVLHPGVFNKKNSALLITIEGGRTINLGNYESARISVSLTLPCDPESLNSAYDWATGWVSGKIDSEINSAKGEGT